MEGVITRGYPLIRETLVEDKGTCRLPVWR